MQTANILKRAFAFNKIVVLPAYNTQNFEIELKKVDNLEKDLCMGPRQILQPDETSCKVVPIDKIDIAIIPAVALDEKGGRIGSGKGYYDRLIPRLAITTRKVALAFEDQIIAQVPIESHDKHVDIIITCHRHVLCRWALQQRIYHPAIRESNNHKGSCNGHASGIIVIFCQRIKAFFNEKERIPIQAKLPGISRWYEKIIKPAFGSS